MTPENQKHHLESILRELSKAGVKFIVAGGVAGVLHGIERTTLDLDIAIDFSAENLSRFSNAVKQLGLIPLVPIEVENLVDPDIIKMMVEDKNAIVYMLADPDLPLRKVDVFLPDHLNYKSLKPKSIAMNLEDFEIKVVTLEKLLEMKQSIEPLRDKDRFDIMIIEKLLKENEKEQ